MKPAKVCALLSFLLIALVNVASAHPFSAKPASLSFIENKGQVTDQFHHSRSDIQFKLAATGGLNIFIGNGALHYQFGKSEQAAAKAGDILLTGKKAERNKQADCYMYRMDVLLIGANPNATVVKEQPQAYAETHYTTGSATAHTYNKITYKDVYPHIDWVLYIKGGQLKHEFSIRQGGNVNDIQLQYGGATSLQVNGDGSLTATTPQGDITEQAPYTYEADGKAVASSYSLAGNILRFATGSYSGDIVIDPTLAWATYYGGLYYDGNAGVATEANGNVYITGQTSSTNNIATTGAYQDTIGGSQDMYLAKFSPAGSLLWGTFLGGLYEDIPYGILTDTSGHIYVCGYSSSTSGVATAGTYQNTFSGYNSTAFLVQFDTAGARNWGTYYGGGAYGYDIGYGIALDSAGDVYMTGVTSNATLIASAGAYQPALAGGMYNGDAFLVKFDHTGNRIWGTYYGSNNDDFGQGVAVDKAGNVFVVGYTENYTSALATPGAFQMYSAGNDDGFIAKFTSGGTRLWGTYYGGTDRDDFVAVTTDTAGNVYACGGSSGFTSLASPGAYQVAPAGFFDGLLVKFDGAGTRQWATYLGGPSTDFINGINISDSGYIFIAGSTSSSTGIASSAAYDPSYSGNGDAFLAKFTQAGASIWCTYYGGSGGDNGRGITSKGTDLYLSGNSESTYGISTSTAYQPTVAGSYDGFLVKLGDCPHLALTTSTAPSAICDSTSFIYIPASNVAGATLTWTRDIVAGITNAAATGADTINETLVNITNVPVTVTYIYTLSLGTCIDTQSIQVVVNPMPMLLSASTANVCSGAPFIYVPVGNVVGATFTWTRNPIPTIANPASAGLGNINETLINTAAVPVVVPYMYTLSALGCTHIVQVDVTVLPAVVAGTIMGADSVCPDSSITLAATPAGGVWSSSSASATVVAGVVTGVSAGTAVISYSLTSPCGTTVATHPVVVKTAAQCTNTDAITTVNAAASQLNIFPNPNEGAFSFLFASAAREDVHVTIANIVGQRVYEATVAANKVVDINLNVPGGVYVVSATSVSGVYVAQLRVK